MLKCLIFFITAASCTTARCYYPDGTLDTKSFVCNTTAVDSGGSSACCSAGDDCHDSGTCFQGWSGIAYRNTCTDPTWKSAACPQFCLESGMLDAGIWIQSCDLRTKSACCVVGSANCCNDTSNIFTYAPGILVAVLGNPGGLNMLVDNSNTTTTTVSNACSSATTVTTPSTLPAATERSSSGSTYTDTLAIILGTVLGAAFVLASAGMLYFRKKYHSQRQQSQSLASAPALQAEYQRDAAIYGNVHFKPHQLDSTDTARYPELQG